MAPGRKESKREIAPPTAEELALVERGEALKGAESALRHAKQMADAAREQQQATQPKGGKGGAADGEAEAELALREAAVVAARRALGEAREASLQAESALRRSFVHSTAARLVDEGRRVLAVDRAIASDTGRRITESLPEGLKAAAAERRRVAAKLRAEAAEAEAQLTQLVDPTFEADARAIFGRSEGASVLHSAWNPATNAPWVFGDAPKTRGFAYPEHTPAPPDNFRLHKRAMLKASDRAVLRRAGAGADGAPGEPEAVSVRRVELGDAAMTPGPLGSTHEAVYLVQNDSTETADARRPARWATEGELSPLSPLGRLSPRPPWSRVWPDNLSFEQLKARAIRQLSAQLRANEESERAAAEAAAYAAELQARREALARAAKAAGVELLREPDALEPVAHPAGAGCSPRGAPALDRLQRGTLATSRTRNPEAASHVHHSRGGSPEPGAAGSPAVGTVAAAAARSVKFASRPGSARSRPGSARAGEAGGGGESVPGVGVAAGGEPALPMPVRPGSARPSSARGAPRSQRPAAAATTDRPMSARAAVGAAAARPPSRGRHLPAKPGPHPMRHEDEQRGGRPKGSLSARAR